MLVKKKRNGKSFQSIKVLPTHQKSLDVKNLRAAFISQFMASSLDLTYIPPDPSQYAWELVDSQWEPMGYGGNPLRISDKINSNFQDESEEIDIFELSKGDAFSDCDVYDSEYVLSDEECLSHSKS